MSSRFSNLYTIYQRVISVKQSTMRCRHISDQCCSCHGFSKSGSVFSVIQVHMVELFYIGIGNAYNITN